MKIQPKCVLNLTKKHKYRMNLASLQMLLESVLRPFIIYQLRFSYGYFCLNSLLNVHNRNRMASQHDKILKELDPYQVYFLHQLSHENARWRPEFPKIQTNF